MKKELQSFCRENGLAVSGSKIEISNRIEAFLETGEIKKPIRKVKTYVKPQTPEKSLSLDTIIKENHRCSQEVRAFFQTVIPTFHFTTHIQEYFKNHAGKTYREAVNAWYEEEKRKKDPSYTKKISPQFEYNQFIRDYFADPNNQGKKHKEAVEAWKKIKQIPGSNRYSSNHV